MLLRTLSAALPPALLILTALSTGACGGSPGMSRGSARTTSANVPRPTAPAATPEPDIDIDAQRQRETTLPMKDYKVLAAEGAIEMHVHAAAAPVVKTLRGQDGTPYSLVSFSIGSDIDVTCHASAAALDLAHWVSAIVDGVHATLTVPPSVRVEAHAGHPLLLVDTLATLEDKGTRKRHFGKFAGMHLDRGSIACVHDGLGYEATFREVIRQLAENASTPDTIKPTFRSISVVRDGDRVVGFEDVRAYHGKVPGQSVQMMMTSGMLTKGNGWAPADAGWWGTVDAGGVLNEHTIRKVNKVKTLEMKLDRKEPGLYAYEGVIDADRKKGSFRSPSPLVTHLSRSQALATFVRDDKKELSLAHFDEDEPTHAPIRATVHHEGTSQVRMDEPKKSYHCVVDGRGLCTRFWRDGSAWQVQRIHVSGKL